MNGLYFAVGGISGVARTPPFAIVVDFTRWRTTIRVLALFGLAIAGATATVVRNSAERSGLPPIENVPEYSRLLIVEVRTFTVRIISDQWTWVIAILLYCSGGVNLTLIGLWGILYIVYDVSVMAASTTRLLGGVGVAVGSPVFGRLSNVIDRQTEVIICGAIVYTSALGLIAIVGDPPLIVVEVVSFLNGSLLGTFVLTYSMIQRRYDDRASDIALRTINGALFFGAASFPTLIGWALDIYWTGEYIDGVRVYTMTGYQAAFAIGIPLSVSSQSSGQSGFTTRGYRLHDRSALLKMGDGV